MGRYSSNLSYNHKCERLNDDVYKISWTFDFYYKNSRLRYPRTRSRITDNKGAERFCKKWNVKILTGHS